MSFVPKRDGLFLSTEGKKAQEESKSLKPVIILKGHGGTRRKSIKPETGNYPCVKSTENRMGADGHRKKKILNAFV